MRLFAKNSAVSIAAMGLILSVVSTTGCSAIFGDTFRDRADDYLQHENAELMAETDSLVFVDGMPLPEVEGDASLAEEFVVPRPEKLAAIDEEQESASLSDYQGESLNPRLEKDGAGTQVLRLDGRFAVAWTSVAEAMADASFKLEDMNRSIGTYYLAIESLDQSEDQSLWEWLFGSNEEMVEQQYLLKMNRSRLGVYLSLQQDAETLADETLTALVLEEIKDLLSAE